MSLENKGEVRASETGILYVAIGWKMRGPLERSVQSVRQHLDLPITVVTDLDGIQDVDLEPIRKPLLA